VDIGNLQAIEDETDDPGNLFLSQISLEILSDSWTLAALD
jgi:hypothetical protein